jgi:prevent-host-death family protein
MMDVTIVFADVERDDGDVQYVTSKVYRLDVEGTAEEFMDSLAKASEFNTPDSGRRIVDMAQAKSDVFNMVEHGEAFAITREGRKVAVLLSYDEYERLQGLIEQRYGARTDEIGE